MEESVGIQKVTRFLFDLGGHPTWSHYNHSANAKFRAALHEKCLPPEEAFREAVKGCRVISGRSSCYGYKYDSDSDY